MFTFKFVRVSSDFSVACAGNEYIIELEPFIAGGRRLTIDPGRPDPARSELIAREDAEQRSQPAPEGVNSNLICDGDMATYDPRIFFDRCYVMNANGKTVEIVYPGSGRFADHPTE